MASFTVPVLTRDRIRKTAEEYLAKVHPSGSIPIPIEEIVDNHEKIDVIPLENLRANGHEAYTARDKKTIYVDNSVYSHRVPHRLRFTLAHELSHILLHPYVFAAADYKSVAEFKVFLSSIREEDAKTIESQAYRMAGHLLVPTSDLSREYMDMAAILKQSDMDITKIASDTLKGVAKLIGDKFQVSSAVIHRCAVRDGLWDWDDIPNI